MEEQQTVQAAYYRGGSSKAVFFHEHDLPTPGSARDRLIKRLMGTPDVLQIDGMGGSRIVTSKAAIVTKSLREDADVDYTFVQAGITEDTISYDGNCGNISSAVGPFAVSEGLIDNRVPGVSIVDGLETQKVRIYQTGTKKIMISHVPVDKNGKVVEPGDFAIAAVSGTGAPILMDYSETAGAGLGRGLLPSSNAIDTLEIGGKSVDVTICDAANLIIFVTAADVGATCTETADQINSNSNLIDTLREVRGKAAQLVGRCSDWREVDKQSPFIPMLVMVAPTTNAEGDINARLILDNRCHDSMAGSGAICTTACSRVQGSVVNQQLAVTALQSNTLRINHPLGMMPVTVSLKKGTQDSRIPTFETLSFVRTARRIMSGRLHVPEEVAFTPVPVPEATASPDPSNTNLTKALCDFIVNTKFEMLDEELITRLKNLILDHLGVAAGAAKGAESSDALFKAVAALGGNHGSSTVVTKGSTYAPQYAGLLNAALGHSFDLDDTHAEAVLHPGVSAIPSALVQAELSDTDGKTFLLAAAVGYEIICRLGRALGTGAYDRGFHNTSTAGIFGAVAAIAKIKGLSAGQIENAFGLALSKAGGSMQFLVNGSWNKRLHPGFAVHDAFVSVALAEAGVVGASQAIEGRYGLLHNFSSASKADGVIKGLGTDWVFKQTAMKPFPCCRMTHSALELAANLGQEYARRNLKEIKIELSPACWSVVGKPDENKVHPKTKVDGQFSVYYQVSVAYLYGMDLGWAVYDKLDDKEVSELSGKVKVIPNSAVADLEARMSATWEDEATTNLALVHPLGEDEHPLTKDRIRGKFMGLAEPVYGAERATAIISAVEGLDKIQFNNLVTLL